MEIARSKTSPLTTTANYIEKDHAKPHMQNSSMKSGLNILSE